MPLIRLDDVTFRRGGREILAGVSWSIERGQHWALLGANGSGKTTLLKIITGYEWVTDGIVTVAGRRFGTIDLRELRKTIGWVSASLEPNLPARDMAVEVAASGIEASLGLYRDFEATEFARARAALGRLGAAGVADQSYGTLSQGERQRVLIARALVNRPALLILDEPCAGLDPAARDSFLGDLGRLACGADSPTLLLVTHHIEEIGPWIEHVCVLKAGRVLASGAKASVLTSATLSSAFDWPCRAERDGDRYRLLPNSERESD